MKNYLIQRKKGILLILVGILIFLLFNIVSVSAKRDLANIHPGAIKFTIEDPVENMSANHNLIVDRKKNDENIYYRVIDSYIYGINLAEYVMARTPYAGDYQILDRPVRFLSAGDDRVEISIKFKVDDIFWETVPDGSYNLQLISNKGKSVKIMVKVKKSPLIKISPRAVHITADDGPGLYQSWDPVNIDINNSNSRWYIDIEANPLIYHDRNNSLSVNPRDIYLSLNTATNFISLDNVYRINGNNYGSRANIDLYFQVDVRENIIAGHYSGQLIFTISEY